MDRYRFAEDLGVLAKDMEVHHVLVGMDVDIGKDQTGDHADDQRDGELLEKVYVVWAEQKISLVVICADRPQGANAPGIISSSAGLETEGFSGSRKALPRRGSS